MQKSVVVFMLAGLALFLVVSGVGITGQATTTSSQLTTVYKNGVWIAAPSPTTSPLTGYDPETQMPWWDGENWQIIPKQTIGFVWTGTEWSLGTPAPGFIVMKFDGAPAGQVYAWTGSDYVLVEQSVVETAPYPSEAPVWDVGTKQWVTAPMPPRFISIPIAPEVFGTLPQEPTPVAGFSGSDIKEKYLVWKSSPTAASTSDFETYLSARKSYLVQMMRSNPNRAYDLLASLETQQALAADSIGYVERPTTLNGSLEMLHTDFFDQGKSVTRYYLVTDDNKRYVIYPARGLKDFLEGETVVRIKGFVIDNELIFDGSNPVIPEVESGIDIIKAKGNPPAVGERKLVVILAYFNDEQQPADITDNLVESLVTNIKGYFYENSYQKLTITGGEVFGWYKLPISSTCDTDLIKAEIIKAADADIYYPDYDILAIFAPFTYRCNLGISGHAFDLFTDTNDGGSRLRGAFIDVNHMSLKPLAHEIGHLLGADHANAVICAAGVPLAEDGCEFSEYGDAFSTMGYGSGHFDAPNKEHLGWFDVQNVRTVTKTGSYFITPLEIADDRLKLLKIPRFTAFNHLAQPRYSGPQYFKSLNPDYIYIEYRRPVGFDARIWGDYTREIMDGAILHIGPPNYPSIIKAMAPFETLNPSLKVGSSFIDPQTNVKITVNSLDDASVSVSVDVPCDEMSQYYIDRDEDGYGDKYSVPKGVILSCTAPPGYVANSLDCSDWSASINPMGIEVCNSFDDDCDGEVNEGVIKYYVDYDGDGYGQDAADGFCSQVPGINYATRAGDCNDKNKYINPAAAEICANNIDENCNGINDDSLDSGACAARCIGTPTKACRDVTDVNTCSLIRGCEWIVGFGGSEYCSGNLGAESCGKQPSQLTCNAIGCTWT